MKTNVLIVGGGAAGFFAAINIAELNPNLTVTIVEKSKNVLQKVKVSGGGRCNVTHAEFNPKELAKNYPRGEKELIGPFHQFCSGDTMAWFQDRGVPLKIEEDGRVFPKSNNSQSIIDCFIDLVNKHKITLLTKEGVTALQQNPEGIWEVTTTTKTIYANSVVIATGSSDKIWNMLAKLGHTIVNPVPSLFTFNIKDNRIKNLAGIAVNATAQIKQSKLFAQGAVLITHWGLSGPAILKLSAWGARELNAKKYNFTLVVNWLNDTGTYEAEEILISLKQKTPGKTIYANNVFSIPKRLWQSLVNAAAIPETLTWAEISKKQIRILANQLTQCEFNVTGKSTFKEEFVTAGGVSLKEVDFKTFKSKLFDSLYFAGEVLDIDAITGGFNFQNAWTGAYLAAKAIAVNSVSKS